MDAQDIPVAQLRSWLKDLKRMSHELRELRTEEKPTICDDKLHAIIAHLQAARAGLIEIAHGIQRDE